MELYPLHEAANGAFYHVLKGVVKSLVHGCPCLGWGMGGWPRYSSLHAGWVYVGTLISCRASL